MPDKKENRTISDNLVYCQNNNCYVRLRTKSAIYIKRESVNGRGYIKNIKRKKRARQRYPSENTINSAGTRLKYSSRKNRRENLS